MAARLVRVVYLCPRPCLCVQGNKRLFVRKKNRQKKKNGYENNNFFRNQDRHAPIKDVAVDGRYNPALFLTSQLGRDVVCQELIQRGMDTVEIRKMIHRTLIANSSDCSDLFKDRNHKASDFKLCTIDTCSYCAKKNGGANLYLYWTLVHVNDLLIQEMLKSRDEKQKSSAVLKFFVSEPLEAKVRDVRTQDGITINAGCYLVGLTRCESCVEKSNKIVCVDDLGRSIDGYSIDK